jgi:fructan beta-fructosidase
MTPVSLVYKSGIYFFYYQSETSDRSDSKSFFVTLSKDLVHWSEPVKAKFATNNSDLQYVNVMINHNDTSSTHNTKNKSLLALLLVKNKNGQCNFILNRSNDNGTTWSADPATVSFPISLMNNYKPTITWDVQHSQWIMALANNEAAEVYSSTDLKSWHKESAFKKPAKLQLNTWTRVSCIPINVKDWALLIDQQLENKDDGSVIQYYIGSFDGHEFKNQSTKQHWLDYGKDNIFSVICDGLLSNQKPVIIGLKSNTNYFNVGNVQTWRVSTTFPRTLEIDSVYNEKLLSVHPVSTINKLIKRTISINNIKLDGNFSLDKNIGFNKTPIFLTVKFETTEMTRMNFPPTFGICLENDKKEKLTIGYNTFRRWYYIDRTNFVIVQNNPQLGGIQYMPCYHTDSTMVVSMILDDNSLELFAENGKLAMTENFLPQQRFNHLSLFAESGFIRVKEINVKVLNSIWE